MRFPTRWTVTATLGLALTPFAAVHAQAGPATAGGAGQAPAAQAPPAATGNPNIAIAPAAAPAVDVVNRFFQAMAAGNLQAAGDLLDPRVTILANGMVAGDRNAYLSGLGKSDAEFLKRARRVLLMRRANTDGTIAWVMSEKLLGLPLPGGGSTELVNAETVILARGPQGWKIIHAHWSSRPAKPPQAAARPAPAPTAPVKR